LSQYDARSGRELGATSHARHESLLASACALVDVWPIYLGRLPPAARPERDGKVLCERPHTNSRCRGLWVHEIKHDGYRLIIRREGKRVRLFTRNGHDWSGRYPLITEAALRNRNSSFVIDGEAVLLGVYGRSDFNGLHSRKHDYEVEFYAFDMLVSDGDDLRRLPLSMRKTNLARILARRVDGIHLAPFEQGEIGPDLFRHACLMGLEGRRNIARACTAPAARIAGSRSRTGSIRRSAG
jgi:ATP-dependent DNA ligase